MGVTQKCELLVSFHNTQSVKTGDSSENEQKMEDCFSRQLLRENVSWLLFSHRKTLNRGGFILRPSEGT